jgi:molybdate transport system substrate-binding protein
MRTHLRGISSMATKPLLTELIRQWQAGNEGTASMESVGGIDAAKRVQSGEAFDVVVLAADAIDKLAATGHLIADTKVDVARSAVAVAVPRGTPYPDLSSEDAVRRAVEGAERIGYSTGPSGVALLCLFERWGLTQALGDRIVQAPPGVPVAELVARSQVSLGFQQLSELMNVDGVEVVGGLPPPIDIVTTFSAAVCATSADRDAAARLLRFMASPEADGTKRQHGMQPARTH